MNIILFILKKCQNQNLNKLNKLNENINRIKSLMNINESEEKDFMNVNKGEDDEDPVQVQGPDGMDDDSDKELGESEISEEGEGETTDTKSADAGASQGYPSLNLWTTGAGRSKGNPIGITKWKSGRKFGPTGNNYKDA